MATTRYVWGQYTKEQQYFTNYGYKEKRTSIGDERVNGYYDTDKKHYIYLARYVNISQSNGNVSIGSTTTYRLEDYSSGYNFGAGYLSLTSGEVVYATDWEKVNANLISGVGVKSEDAYEVTSEYYSYQDYYYVQGSFIKNISNSNSNAYPDNSYSGSYWYVKLGSDIIDPDAVKIPDSIMKNDVITIEITPSSKQTQPGNIYYTYQYSFGDGTWKDLVSNVSQTTYELEIPAGTPSVQIRVQAKDDLGFTSSTWIESNTVEVINNIAPSAPKSISVSNVYADQVTTISIGAATDEDGYIAKYIYERSIDGAQFEVFYTDTENLLKATDQINSIWGTVAYRVKAVDDQGMGGPYVTSITYAINEGYLAIANPSYNLGDQTNPFYFIFMINSAGEPVSTDVNVKVLLDNKDYYQDTVNFEENISLPIDVRLLSSNTTHNLLIQATKEGYVMAEASNAFYIPGISAPAGGVIEQLQNSKGQAVLPYTLAQCVIGKDGKDMNALLEEYQNNQMRVFSDSYQGTGTFGESSPNTLIFDFQPKFAFVIKEGDSLGFMWGGSPTVGNIHISSNLNTLSWYSDSAEEQYNSSGIKYYYTVLG